MSPSDLSEALNWIKEAKSTLIGKRKSLKMTQADVAKEIATSPSVISRFETETTPRLDLFLLYAKAVGIGLSLNQTQEE